MLSNESGQAIVEYLLMLSLAIMVVTIISKGFSRSVFSMWKMMARDISAACPGCPPDPSIR